MKARQQADPPRFPLPVFFFFFFFFFCFVVFLLLFFAGSLVGLDIF